MKPIVIGTFCAIGELLIIVGIRMQFGLPLMIVAIGLLIIINICVVTIVSISKVYDANYEEMKQKHTETTDNLREKQKNLYPRMHRP